MDRACQRLASQVEAVASTFAAVSQPVPLPEVGKVFACLHTDDEISRIEWSTIPCMLSVTVSFDTVKMKYQKVPEREFKFR